MILHADLPEDLAAVPAGHGELQRVVGVLLQDEQADVSMDADQMKEDEDGGAERWNESV